MKKLIAILLTVVLVVGMSTIALAEPISEDPVDQSVITIEKDFLLTNPNTTRPAETFVFNIESIGVRHSQYTPENMPEFGIDTFEIPFTTNDAALTTKSATLTLPTYEHVGVFTYELTEEVENTAGVDYDGRVLVLTVYVTNDGDDELIRYATLHDKAATDPKVKVKGFENTFSAGDFSVSKTVTGNMGEKDRYFNITINLTAPSAISTVPVTYDGGKYVDQTITFNEDLEAELELEIKDEDTITFKNLPHGVTWTVSEEDLDGEGYTVTISKDTGTINGATDGVLITNHRQQEPDTGINLDSLPYLIILAIAISGLILFAVRKRWATNE